MWGTHRQVVVLVLEGVSLELVLKVENVAVTSGYLASWLKTA